MREDPQDWVSWGMSVVAAGTIAAVMVIVLGVLTLAACPGMP